MLWDEREIRRFQNDDEESLFRYFSARSGICRSDFVMILEKGTWIHIKHVGQQVLCDEALHIVVEGAMEGIITGWKRLPTEDFKGHLTFHIVMGSGEIFDLSLANVFGVPIGFYNETFKARALLPNTLLFAFSKQAMLEFAANSPPIVPQAWKNLIAFAVADVAHRQRKNRSTDQALKEIVQAGLRHPDFSLADEEEIQEPPCACKNKAKRINAFLMWIITSMDPRPPRGLRHRAVPKEMLLRRTSSLPESSSSVSIKATKDVTLA